MDVCDLQPTPLYSDGLLIATFYTRQFYQTILHCKLYCNAVTGLGNRDSLQENISI